MLFGFEKKVEAHVKGLRPAQYATHQTTQGSKLK